MELGRAESMMGNGIKIKYDSDKLEKVHSISKMKSSKCKCSVLCLRMKKKKKKVNKEKAGKRDMQ